MGLLSDVIQESFSCLIDRSQGDDSCHEEKYLEGADRGRVYHLPILFQPFDGGIWAFRYGDEEDVTTAEKAAVDREKESSSVASNYATA